MKKLPHIYGKPLIFMMFILVFVVILFAGRCGHSQPGIIVTDTVMVDTCKINLSDTTKVKSRKPRVKKRPSAPKKRVVSSRDYLYERIDSVK